jgi:Cupin superfamily protein
VSPLLGEQIAAAVAKAILDHGDSEEPLHLWLDDRTHEDRRAVVCALWSDIARSGSLWSNVRMIHHGRDVHPTEFMRGRIGDGLVVHAYLDARSISGFLNRGATLIYNHLHETSYSIQCIQEILEYHLDARVWIQAYVTKATTTAFGLHSDDHNFVALQLLGSKTWELEETRRTLHAGEGIFLRSGTRHAVRGVGELSLHLTIAFDWLPTPAGRRGSRLSQEAFEEHLKVDRLGSGLPVVLDASHDDPQIGLRFGSRVKPRLCGDGRHIRLSCSAGRYRLDGRLRPALELLQSGRQISQSELSKSCGLTPAQVAAFVHFAVKRGILFCGS